MIKRLWLLWRIITGTQHYREATPPTPVDHDNVVSWCRMKVPTEMISETGKRKTLMRYKLVPIYRTGIIDKYVD